MLATVPNHEHGPCHRLIARDETISSALQQKSSGALVMDDKTIGEFLTDENLQ